MTVQLQQIQMFYVLIFSQLHNNIYIDNGVNYSDNAAERMFERLMLHRLNLLSEAFVGKSTQYKGVIQ